MRIRAPNKCGLLTGSKPKPPADGKQLETWLIDNNRVKSWLIDSMSMLLMQRFICLQTAEEIWETVAKTFHIFFADLDPEFNQAQCEILRKDPPFDLKSCYAY
ncbi:hypothetical protein ES288_D10G129600v1, partial [Gossypium darwinii]